VISLMLSVEDVACPVDDMRKSSFGLGREGRENKGSGYKIIDGFTIRLGAQGCGDQETPARHVGVSWKCYGIMIIAPRPYTVQWSLGWRLIPLYVVYTVKSRVHGFQ